MKRADADPPAAWYQDAIFYQLPVKSFFDSSADGLGDFPGLTSKLDYLQHLDIDINWSPHPPEDEARRVYERIWSQLGPRTVESLIDLPLMTDPATLATLDVLTKLGPPAHYTDANLRSLIICQGVNLSLESGNCDGSCYAYAVLGGIAGPYFGDYQAGFRFARLSYELVEQRGLKRFQARTYLNFGYLLMFWTRHVRKGRELLAPKGSIARGRILRLERHPGYFLLKIDFQDLEWPSGHARLKLSFDQPAFPTRLISRAEPGGEIMISRQVGPRLSGILMFWRSEH